MNGVILESVDNLDADNLALRFRCIADKCVPPRTELFVNKNGVKESDTIVPFDEVAKRLQQK